MSNILDFQVSRVAPSKVGGIGTSVKYFPRPFGSSLTSGLPSTPSATNPTGALWVPVGPQFDGQQFSVLASGSFGTDSGDPSGTVTVKLYAVTGTLASPTYTALASTGAVEAGISAPLPWALDVTLLGDNNSGFLTGYYSALASGANGGSISGLANSSPKVVDNIISGLNFVSGNPALQQGAVFGLVVGVTFGTTDTSNTATMTQFSVES
jgi:hypothetical protein